MLCIKVNVLYKLVTLKDYQRVYSGKTESYTEVYMTSVVNKEGNRYDE